MSRLLLGVPMLKLVGVDVYKIRHGKPKVQPDRVGGVGANACPGRACESS